MFRNVKAVGSIEIASTELGQAYLCIIDLAGGEQGVQRVVGWEHESGNIRKKFAGNIEKDHEEVHRNQAKDSIDLGDGSGLLKVIEKLVLGQLSRQHHQHQRTANTCIAPFKHPVEENGQSIPLYRADQFGVESYPGTTSCRRCKSFELVYAISGFSRYVVSKGTFSNVRSNED